MTRLLPVVFLILSSSPIHAGKEKTLIDAVSLYASFDEQVQADKAGGLRTVSTRFTEKDKLVFQPGFDKQVFRIAKDKGISGGALEVVDVLPNNGRIFFPAKGNIAFKKGGWGGAVSTWINTDPNELLKTKFCDPVQITQKGANNGGLWYDFNAAKPRDLRMGAFSAVPDGTKPTSEDDPQAPMVKVPGVKFKAGEWHHVALTWKNLDTGRDDGRAALYIDGKAIGAVENRAISMDWETDKAGIYVAVNFIGLLDEFAIFGRTLSAEEIARLHKNPGLLKGVR